MRPFQIEQPKTIAEALRLKNSSAQFIAGGTNQLDLMKKHIVQPETLIDLQHSLSNVIKEEKKHIVIGANVKNATLGENPLILQHIPLVAEAVLTGASQQIRNMASTAGNLMQRTRCVYFYDPTTPCNKREPQSGCSALNGENRMSAIVGYNPHCVATHPSDLCIALVALDAKVYATSTTKQKIEIPFKDFHKLPENTPWLDHNLPNDTIITHLEIPKDNFHQHYAYVKLRDRTSYAFALISVAAAFQLNGDKMKNVRLASGGVAHKPWRWFEAEKFLNGKTPTRENFKQAALLITKDIQPLSGNAYKIDLLKGAVLVALENALNPNSKQN